MDIEYLKNLSNEDLAKHFKEMIDHYYKSTALQEELLKKVVEVRSEIKEVIAEIEKREATDSAAISIH